MDKVFIFIITCIFSLSSMAQWDYDLVPDPISVGGFVSDPNAYLQPHTIDSLNYTIANMTDKTGTEFAIVVLDSISETDYTPFTFALLLFENRGIGKATNDNGLLLLIVVKLREYRFVTGYGIEHILTDAKLRSIGEEFLVPHFKTENYDEGLYQTVSQVSQIIINHHDNPPENEDYNSSDYFTDFNTFDFVLLRMKYYAIFGLIWIIIGLIVYFFLIKKQRKPINEMYSSMTKVNENIFIHRFRPVQKLGLFKGRETLQWVLVFLIPGILLPLHMTPALAYPFLPGIFLMIATVYIYTVIYQTATMSIQMQLIEEASLFKDELAHNYVVYGPKLQQLVFMPIPFILFFTKREKMLKEANIDEAHCPTCKVISTLQATDTTSKLLGNGYAKEQELDVFKYRIYTCPKGHIHAMRLHGHKAYSYNKCSACEFTTSSITERKTLKEATYSETGEVINSHSCLFCGFKKTETVSIPRKGSSYSSSSYSSGKSYSSSSRSYSSSGSSSRSSSSSRSWGGGRTGGGGAGGKW
jgi:uncharacterized protein